MKIFPFRISERSTPSPQQDENMRHMAGMTTDDSQEIKRISRHQYINERLMKKVPPPPLLMDQREGLERERE